METQERGVQGREGGGEEQSQRCQFWLCRKGRLCASAAVPGLLYCGNHNPSLSETRVACPLDPSHTILQKEVQAHIKKCPVLKQVELLEQQPYYCKGVNAGSDEEDNCFSSKQQESSCKGISDLMRVSECGVQSQSQDCQKNGNTKEYLKVQELSHIAERSAGNDWMFGKTREAVNSMCGKDFRKIVEKIESAYDFHQQDFEQSFQQPFACRKWLNSEVDRRIPFQEKHLIQQASLLGNLEAFGLLRAPNTNITAPGEEKQTEGIKIQSTAKQAFIEFGAGRGYLTHMLIDCYGVGNVVLVEQRAYKFKADRMLRELKDVSWERLRLDIENLELKGIHSLRGHGYIAVSKHLCGSATDLTLRCCLKEAKQGSCGNERNAMTGHHDVCFEPCLEGIGIATCCHHLCQWKSYVNKEFFQRLGFSKEDFCILTWLTSWAVSGDGKHTFTSESVDEFGCELNACRLGIDNRYKASALDWLKCIGPAERLALGWKCKHLLDIGRLHWLQQNGMEAKIVIYVPAKISPENKLLLARSTTENCLM